MKIVTVAQAHTSLTKAFSRARIRNELQSRIHGFDGGRIRYFGRPTATRRKSGCAWKHLHY